MNGSAAVFRAVLRNDLRLLLRGVAAGRWKVLNSFGLMVLIYLGANVMAIGACMIFRHAPSLGTQAVGWSLFSFFMLSAGMLTSVALLYDRADANLLLSSPASPTAILLARLVSLAASVWLSVALFLSPALNGAIAGFSRAYLWGYLVWALLAVAAAAAGLGVTLILVALIGARRARVTAQVIGTLVTVGGALFFQFANAARSRNGHSELLTAYARIARHLGYDRVALAAQGNASSLLLLAVAALAGTGAMAWLMQRFFVAGLQEGTERIPRAASSKAARPWSTRLEVAAFWKDARLIWRDPLLLVQVAPQALFILPAFMGIGHSARLGPVSFGIAGFVLVCMCGPTLTAVCVDGEEGWDLIRQSPTDEMKLRRSKVAAGLALPLILCVLACAGTGIAGRPAIALLATALSLLCGGSLCWFEAAHINPTPRKDVLKSRRGKMSISGVVTALTAFAGAGALALIAHGGALPVLCGWLLLLLLVIIMGIMMVAVTPTRAALTYE